MTHFRQSREAALIYTNSEEELKKLKNSKKRFTAAILIAFLLAVLASIFILGAFTIYENEADDFNDYYDYSNISLSSTLIEGTIYAAAANTNILYDGLSEKLLRIHIIANSDSDEDQSIKLLVRNSIVVWISENMPENISKEEAVIFLNNGLDEIVSAANAVLIQKGCEYTAAAEITASHFPGKVYGDFYLPAGNYDALRIVLGAGQGKNWWCLAFPALCLYGNADYEDESGSRSSYPLFRVILDEKEYEEIKVENVRIDFKCKWLKKLFN